MIDAEFSPVQATAFKESLEAKTRWEKRRSLVNDADADEDGRFWDLRRVSGCAVRDRDRSAIMLSTTLEKVTTS